MGFMLFILLVVLSLCTIFVPALLLKRTNLVQTVEGGLVSLTFHWGSSLATGTCLFRFCVPTVRKKLAKVICVDSWEPLKPQQ